MKQSDKSKAFPVMSDTDISLAETMVLRWPNTVFAHAFADPIQRVHKYRKKQTCRQQSDYFIYSTLAVSVLFFSIIEGSVLMALVFYYKDILE